MMINLLSTISKLCSLFIQDLTQVRSSDMEPDLMEYLMAPSGVQTMVPENWEAVWQFIHREDRAKSLIVSSRVNGIDTFECKICRDAGRATTTMSMSHLCHSDCQQALSETVDSGSLLGALVHCACKCPPKVCNFTIQKLQ